MGRPKARFVGNALGWTLVVTCFTFWRGLRFRAVQVGIIKVRQGTNLQIRK